MSSLELQHVTKTYGDGATKVIALDDASVRIAPGDLVALIGPSGSGKSTLLSIAGALLQPDSGRVLLAGKDITEHTPSELTQMRLEKIGFIFQSSNLVPYLTARDQLLLIGQLLGLTDKEARADRLLADLGLTERGPHYPEELSGGQRQRVAIGRALMNDPDLVLADEPTASLDSTRGRQVVTLLVDEIHERGKAGILVTHDERLIDLCDRVLHTTDGRLARDEAAIAVGAA